MLVFESDLAEIKAPEDYAVYILASRLAEKLSIPVIEGWSEALWDTGSENELIGELVTGGECMAGYWVHTSEGRWSEVSTQLLKGGKIRISENQ